eukprot:g3083.t1 g3083   contig12:1380101-1382653(-)
MESASSLPPIDLTDPAQLSEQQRLLPPPQSKCTKPKTRVFLRVKRRRSRLPSPTTTNSTTAPLFKSVTNTSATTTITTTIQTNATISPTAQTPKRSNSGPVKRPADVNSDNDSRGTATTKDSAPELIRLALPCISTKRRKISRRHDEKDEMALIQRLNSSFSLQHNGNGGGDTMEDGEDKKVFHSPSRNNNLKIEKDNITKMEDGVGLDDERRTPPPGSSSVDHSTATSNQHSIVNSPFMKSSRSGSSTSITHQYEQQLAPPQSKTPAKPKRTVVFRKMTTLRQCLDTKMQQHEQQVLGDDIAQIQSEQQFDLQQNSWNSKGEEKEKWLRVVDVMLQEDDDACSNELIVSQKVDVSSINGDGQRVRRLRPRPASDAHAEEVRGDRKSAKRRKLGLVVEQSRTVLESDFWNTIVVPVDTQADCKLDSGIVCLIDYSLASLCLQGGGSVSPHLSFLRIDSRLGFVRDTPRGKAMINHKLAGEDGDNGGDKGRTVLHFAALWGDLSGVRAALDMGADPTIVDDRGLTPSALARLRGHQDVLTTFLEEEKRINANGDDGGYYYEVYCLEEEDAPAGTDQLNGGAKINRDANQSPYSSLTTAESDAADSPPGLMRSNALCQSNEEDEDEYGLQPNGLMELRKGLGYWNEQGELILEAGENRSSASSSLADPNTFGQQFFHSGKRGMSEDDDSSAMMVGDEEHDSNAESFDGNDYPDDQSFGDDDGDGMCSLQNGGNAFRCSVDSDYDEYLDADAHLSMYRGDQCDSDDSDDDWKLDFRNRFIAKKDLNGSDDDESGDEYAARGFGTHVTRRMHGWDYVGGVNGDSDYEDYAGPMRGDIENTTVNSKVAYDPDYDE